jgi:hypothetical protein
LRREVRSRVVACGFNFSTFFSSRNRRHIYFCFRFLRENKTIVSTCFFHPVLYTFDPHRSWPHQQPGVVYSGIFNFFWAFHYVMVLIVLPCILYSSQLTRNPAANSFSLSKFLELALCVSPDSGVCVVNFNWQQLEKSNKNFNKKNKRMF